MGTKAHTILLTAVYAGLAVCVTALVTTATIENFPHQVLGIAFFVLALCHLVLNRFWICHALLGTWDARRVILTVVAGALGVLTLVQAVNCLLLSSFFWSLLPKQLAYFSSSLHMSIGCWLFFLAAVHFGLNSNAPFKNKLHLTRDENGKVLVSLRNAGVLVAWAALVVAGAYGAFAFIQLGMPQFMFMAPGAQVVPLEGGALALAGRFVRYVCVGVAIAGIAHGLSLVLQSREHAAAQRHGASRPAASDDQISSS